MKIRNIGTGEIQEIEGTEIPEGWELVESSVEPLDTTTEPVADQVTDNPPIDFQALLRDQINRANTLERRIQQMEAERNRPAPVAEKPIEELNAQFFQNPIELLRQEISRQISPLVEHTTALRKKSAYDTLKEQFKANPRYSSHFADIEETVDQLMARNEPTESNMQAVVLGCIGALMTGEIPRKTPVDTNPEKTPTRERSVVTPPHMRPSAPARPVANRQVAKKEYDENARRLMREYKMTEEEYDSLMNASPNEVVTIGKEKK